MTLSEDELKEAEKFQQEVNADAESVSPDSAFL